MIDTLSLLPDDNSGQFDSRYRVVLVAQDTLSILYHKKSSVWRTRWGGLLFY